MCGFRSTGFITFRLVLVTLTHRLNRPVLPKWVVRVTDDTYVNIANLLVYTGQFDPALPWYFGSAEGRADVEGGGTQWVSI